MNAAFCPLALPIDRDRIPKQLTDLNRWVPWRAGQPNEFGKFSKVPISPKTGRPISANDPTNWLSFADACAAYDRGECSGIGIALSEQPAIQTEGHPVYLVAIDLDNCGERMGAVKEHWEQLGRPYVEVSPSGKGIRMFGLSKVLLKGGNAGAGRELYAAGRFMTVTGNAGRGTLSDATEGLQRLHAAWFPPKLASRGMPPMLAHLISSPTLETPANIDRVKAQLACVSPDCAYERWRDITWSVLSTRWGCAEEIAREWSASAPHRFDERAFEQLCRNFVPSRGITLGTLVHHAKEGGWLPVAVATVARLDGGEVRSRLLTRQDLQRLPAMQWRVRGVLPARGLAAVYGPSGSGKTFLALDLACSVACAMPLWFGAKVKPAPVAYMALEGEAGIKTRLDAWEKHNDWRVPDAARFVLGGFTLLRPEDGEKLAAEVLARLGTGVVVVVDTLNQSAPGADENASADMGRVIANAKNLADAIEGVVVLVHHAGKDASRGMRGHSSLFAAMDTVIEVSSGPSGRAWRLSKSKEGESGASHPFELMSHIVGTDEDGADVRSCAVRPMSIAKATPSKPVSGKHRTAVLEALKSITTVPGISLDAAVLAVAPKLDCEDARRRSRALETIRSLLDAGHLLEDSEGLLCVS